MATPNFLEPSEPGFPPKALDMTVRGIRPLLAMTLLCSLIHSARGQDLQQDKSESPSRPATANAISQASDAFGFKSGAEVSGLYDEDNARGFSPVAAGNIRVDGLYADLQGPPSSRLSNQSRIRIGAAALGSLLSAPSGLVDYGLRPTVKSGDATLRLGLGPFRGVSAEFDATLAWAGDEGALNLGAGLSDGNDFRGTEPRSGNFAWILRQAFAPNGTLLLFQDVNQSQRRVEPRYYTAGAFAPPRVERGAFLGQSWSNFEYTVNNAGVIAKLDLQPELKFKAGLFRSTSDVKADTYDLFENVDRSGQGARSVYLFPSQRYASTSGEAQLSYVWGEGARQQLTLAFRGRSSDARYGGETLFGPP